MPDPAATRAFVSHYLSLDRMPSSPGSNAPRGFQKSDHTKNNYYSNVGIFQFLSRQNLSEARRGECTVPVPNTYGCLQWMAIPSPPSPTSPTSPPVQDYALYTRVNATVNTDSYSMQWWSTTDSTKQTKNCSIVPYGINGLASMLSQV